jgi:metal-sulfur cluster biosynthetic enzyme
MSRKLMTEVQDPVLAVREALHDVVDPEIGINIVDLGLVYGVRVEEGVAHLDITLTSAACPLTDVIEGQIFNVLDGLVDDHIIEWVWVPPWSPASMTAEGKDQARAIGLAI